MRNSEHKTKPVSLGFQGGAPSGGGEQGRVRPGTTSVCYPRARFRSPAKNWNLVQPVELAVRSETLSAECLVRLPDAAVQTKATVPALAREWNRAFYPGSRTPISFRRRKCSARCARLYPGLTTAPFSL